MSQNRNIVLVMGRPNTGKSSSLRNLVRQDKFIYMNADLKEIPFKSNFMEQVDITDPWAILDYIQEIEATEGVEGAVLDTLTFLMTTFERVYVNTAANTQKAWGDYGNFYRELIHAIKSGTKDYAIMAHEDTFLNEQTATMESRVPIKGAVGKVGVEADFTTIVSAKQVPIKKLDAYSNDLLHITDEEREDGVKRVFMTRINKETAGEKMRSPIGLWSREELYIDNDLEQVFARLKQFYGS